MTRAKDPISDEEKAANPGLRPEDEPTPAEVPADIDPEVEPHPVIATKKEATAAEKQYAELLETGLAPSDINLVTDREGRLIRAERATL